MRPRIWYLKVTSFVGIGAGARHSYGTIHGPTKVELVRLLDEKGAEDLNRLDQTFDRDYFTWEPDMDTNRFDHDRDVEAAALAVWPHIAGPEDVLVVGDPSYAEPHRPLAGPPSVVRLMQMMYDAAQQMDWDGGMVTVSIPGYDDVVVDSDLALDALSDHWMVIEDRYESPTRRDNQQAQVRQTDGSWEFVKIEEGW